MLQVENVARKNQYLLSAILLTLAFGKIATAYFFGDSLHEQLFNADALYLPTLINDILGEGGAIKDWFLTPAPYFFPDYPIFLLAYMAGPTAYSQIIIYALAQTALTFLVLWCLARQTAGASPFFTAAFIFATVIWLTFSAGGAFSIILSSAYHYGAFLVALLQAALWIKHRREPGRVLLATILILSFATSLSDNLFLVQFTFPLVVTEIVLLVLGTGKQRPPLKPLILVATASLLGSVSARLMIDNNTRPMSIGVESLFSRLVDIHHLLVSAISSSPVLILMSGFYLVLALGAFAKLFRRDDVNPERQWLVLFSFLSIGATIGAVALVESLPPASRYLIPVYFWPVILSLIFLSGFLRHHFVSVAAGAALLLWLPMGWGLYQTIDNNALRTTYYPEGIACIDAILEEKRLNNGIAPYWDAKYLQTFSRLDLNLAQHFEDLKEQRWITSRQYFRDRYDFAIISENADPPYRISSRLLTRINDEPQAIKSCGERRVYVYGENKLRTRKILGVGDSYTWKACELPTRIGTETGDCAITKTQKDQSGFLTFGPYEELPKGDYEFELAYSSEAGKADAVGSWDVVIALPEQAREIQKGMLTGTDGKTGTITSRFRVNPEHNMEKVEIRTLAKPDVDLEIIHLRIRRVQ